MASIKEDIRAGADWMAHALTSSGYRADFSPASLWEVDRFFDDHSRSGKAKAGGLLSQDLGQRIFAIGSYMGEVIRRELGGEWVGDENDPQVEVSVALKLPGGAVCWPIQRAMTRLKNGNEDGVAAWGSGLGVNPGQRPEPRVSFFKRLFRRR